MAPKQFQNLLSLWYRGNKRSLPWRDTQDPYKIWLSEIILQQTRVKQGLPYYYKFLDHFPDVSSLAAASEQEILRLWQGLGYYSRARNLHLCAKEIAENRNGIFPATYKELIKLRGIGSYTGAAIASFAYKEKVAVVDGNVLRVLSRIFGVEDDIATTSGHKVFTLLANQLICISSPDIHNQAIMEFGALQCTPVNPDCHICVLKNNCFAYKHDMQKILPVKNKKIKNRNRYFIYLVIEYNGKYFMKQRKGKDIWGGLYDFYLIENEAFISPDKLQDDVLKKLLMVNSEINDESRTYCHKLTHQTLNVQFVHVKLNDANIAGEFLNFPNFELYNMEEIFSLPKPILIHKYLIDKLNMLN